MYRMRMRVAAGIALVEGGASTVVTLRRIPTTQTVHVQTRTVVVPTTVAPQSEQSTPWGWVAFGILAAGLAGVGVYWLVRRRNDQKPSVP